MTLQIVTWLLFFALFYLLVTSLIFIRNRFDLTPLNSSFEIEKRPTVSVCIPARNEEKSLGNLLNSLTDQTWNHFDVHILDDQSDDQTFEIARSFEEKYPDIFFAHEGEEKPEGWLGKPWACQQLATISDGEILLFLDADTIVEPRMVEYTVNSMYKYELDMLTVWPTQKLITFWEQTIIPLIYYALLTALPSIYVYRKPRWLPSKLQNKMAPKFAAACGQCIAFKRKTYQKIGGHETVKNEIVEDVELAKVIKREGYRLRMFNGVGSINCRMYNSGSEIFQGLRKNFLLGFNNHIPIFVTLGFLHFIVFVLPFITFFASFFVFDPTVFFLSISCMSIILIERLILALWYQINPIFAFTHPIAVLWFELLAIVKIRDYYKGRKIDWKGRSV